MVLPSHLTDRREGSRAGRRHGQMTLGHTRSLTVSMLVAALLCAPAAATQVQLAWTPVPGSAGYRVYWRPSSQPYGQGIDVGDVLPDADGIVRSVVGDVA